MYLFKMYLSFNAVMDKNSTLSNYHSFAVLAPYVMNLSFDLINEKN
jgi:hypothetical protein